MNERKKERKKEMLEKKECARKKEKNSLKKQNPKCEGKKKSSFR
tara:strand:+ start:560 stop:691 length:132 start_codon:yes stop_codon:yes gene_type:complete